MDKILNQLQIVWRAFTPARRKKFYQLIILIGVVLVAHGVVDADTWQQWLAVAGTALGTVAAPAVAHANVTE